MSTKILALTLIICALPVSAQAAGKIAVEIGLINGFGVSVPVTERTAIRLGTGMALLQGYSADLRLFRDNSQAGSYWYVSAYRYDKFLGFSTTPGTVIMAGAGITWGKGKRIKWGAEIGPSYHVEDDKYGVGANAYLKFNLGK